MGLCADSTEPLWDSLSVSAPPLLMSMHMHTHTFSPLSNKLKKIANNDINMKYLTFENIVLLKLILSGFAGKNIFDIKMIKCHYRKEMTSIFMR